MKEQENGRNSFGFCIWVRVCVWEGESERERACVCERGRESERVCVCVRQRVFVSTDRVDNQFPLHQFLNNEMTQNLVRKVSVWLFLTTQAFFCCPLGQGSPKQPIRPQLPSAIRLIEFKFRCFFQWATSSVIEKQIMEIENRDQNIGCRRWKPRFYSFRHLSCFIKLL